MDLLFIGLGGFVGAISRYLAASFVHRFLNVGFPYGTLFVNVTGSFFLCFFLPLSLEVYQIPASLRAAITVGFCGAFTTFSTFSFETLSLLQDGYHSAAFFNVFGNLFLCLFAGWLGFALSRLIG
ncbi:MAG: fluoride efflux transporter CrcB [Thermodesulfobacteria bacterium]|nr:fluoride efflux transporter CrcB [Thermodesulfobacteriota bacterium]